jgi:hypothetical protein
MTSRARGPILDLVEKLILNAVLKVAMALASQIAHKNKIDYP